jgi:hypothetical protein
MTPGKDFVMPFMLKRFGESTIDMTCLVFCWTYIVVGILASA